MTRRASPGRALAIAAALTLVATGCHRAVSVGGSTVTPGGVPGTSGGVSGAGGGLPGAPGGVLEAGQDNTVTVDGKARSVETTAAVTGLTSVHLSGSSLLTATGDVVDRTGRDLGTGTLRATGTDVAVSGPSLQLASRMRIQPGGVTVNNGTSGAIDLGFSGSATVISAHLTFQPPPPNVSATEPPAPGTATTAAPTTTVPPAVPVAGPVTLRASGLHISGSGLRLSDPPTDVTVASGEADLSWAGSGSITAATGPLRAAYLGVRAQQLRASLHRTSAEVDVHGTGLALQAYANGVPQFRVGARIDVLSSGATTGFLSRRHAFVWTPRNLDNTYDMAILSIRPANAAASGVHLGLRPMPPMFGGEPHALVGGDTAGLKSGDAVDSLVARHGDDKRSIGYDAPPGVPLVLIVQGNFDPITVTVTTY